MISLAYYPRFPRAGIEKIIQLPIIIIVEISSILTQDRSIRPGSSPPRGARCGSRCRRAGSAAESLSSRAPPPSSASRSIPSMNDVRMNRSAPSMDSRGRAFGTSAVHCGGRWWSSVDARGRRLRRFRSSTNHGCGHRRGAWGSSGRIWPVTSTTTR